LPDQQDTREQAVDLRFALRSALQPSGDFERILVLLREAEALAAALDNPRRLGQASLFLSRYFSIMGAYDQAIAAGQRTLAHATASGDVVLHAQAHQFLGVAYHAQGDYRRAIDHFMQTVMLLDGGRRHERFGQVFLPAVFSRAWLSRRHAELGSFAEGSTLGEEGRQIAAHREPPEAEPAETYYHQALTLAEALGMRPLQAHCHRGLGTLYATTGRLEQARVELSTAIDLYRTMAMTFWLPEAEAALARVEGR
jgi:tetratricopeptide (TPR) repeat protein